MALCLGSCQGRAVLCRSRVLADAAAILVALTLISTVLHIFPLRAQR